MTVLGWASRNYIKNRQRSHDRSRSRWHNGVPCGLEKGTVGSNPNQHIPSSFKCAHPLGVVLWRYGGLCAPTTLVDGLRILGRTAENHPTVVTDRAPYRLGFTGDLQILTPLCRTRAQWVSCDVARVKVGKAHHSENSQISGRARYGYI